MNEIEKYKKKDKKNGNATRMYLCVLRKSETDATEWNILKKFMNEYNTHQICKEYLMDIIHKTQYK